MIVFASLLCPPLVARASPHVEPRADLPSWHARQATGAPDTPEPGDHPTAWASSTPDGGPEWLELAFARPASVHQIRIVESCNPGAIVRIVGLLEHGEVVLWEGHERTRAASRTLSVRPDQHPITDRIRIELDTQLVAGWNEIDAVQLVGHDDAAQWAQEATASSSFGQGAPLPTDPLAHLIGRRVTAHVADQVVEGELIAIDSATLQIRGPLQDHVIARRWLQLLQWER